MAITFTLSLIALGEFACSVLSLYVFYLDGNVINRHSELVSESVCFLHGSALCHYHEILICMQHDIFLDSFFFMREG